MLGGYGFLPKGFGSCLDNSVTSHDGGNFVVLYCPS